MEWILLYSFQITIFLSEILSLIFTVILLILPKNRTIVQTLHKLVNQIRIKLLSGV